VMEMVSSGASMIGIGGGILKQDDTLTAERIGHAFMTPGASPPHPLAPIKRPLRVCDGREEGQLVVTHAPGVTNGRDFNLLSYKAWRVSDIATKHQLIRGGLGWGGLPASLIYKDLRKGRLVRLDLEAYEQHEYPIYSIRKLANPPGPAGTWLIEA